jgi:peptide deformylase
LKLDNGRLRAKLLEVNDSLHLGFGDLHFKVNNVSGHLRDLADQVNVTALIDRLDAMVQYMRTSEVTRVVMIACTITLFVGVGLTALSVSSTRAIFTLLLQYVIFA